MPSALSYGHGRWTSYAKHAGKNLNSFHLRYLRRIVNIKWQYKVINSEVLQRAKASVIDDNAKQEKIKSVKACNKNGWKPYSKTSELMAGRSPHGRQTLRYEDIC